MNVVQLSEKAAAQMYAAAFFYPKLIWNLKKGVTRRGKKAEIIYSFVYASRADSYDRFYDCTDAECHLSVVYQFHCAQCWIQQ